MQTGNRIANFFGGGTMIVNHQSYEILDLVAPGDGVTSCVMGGWYESWGGTSMATPLVSGLAALIIERHPNRRNCFTCAESRAFGHTPPDRGLLR